MKARIRAALVRLGNLVLAAKPRALVLCYHSIDPSTPFRSAIPAEFDEQLAWLRAHCDIVPLREIAVRSRELSRPVVAITFDDGYADNAKHALPLLLKHAAVATFFVTSGFVDEDPAVLARMQSLRACDANELHPLAWTQVRELHAAGMEVGSHTVTHSWLVRLSLEEITFELRSSRARIEDQLGAAVESFAYPFGRHRRDFDGVAIEAARAAGYARAVTTCARAVAPGDSPWLLPRFIATRESIASLASKATEPGWDAIGRCQEAMPGWLARTIGPVDYT